MKRNPHHIAKNVYSIKFYLLHLIYLKGNYEVICKMKNYAMRFTLKTQ